MNEFSKKIYYYLLICGLIFSVIGLYGVFSPVIFSNYLIYILAFFFFMNGIKNFTKGIEYRNLPDFHWGTYLFLGIIEVIVSFSLFTYPFANQIMLVVYCGIFMIIKGIFIIFNLIFDKKLFPYLTNLGLGSGIIDMIFGILLVTLPFFAQEFFVLCIAWYILFVGINFIASGFAFKKIQK